ncbi:MAG: histidinol-phosphate transaminase [Gammaproteobacteria bacterium]|nr:histidinol-phosphate transaminase [Gammaproteobacteria bacterium]
MNGEQESGRRTFIRRWIRPDLQATRAYHVEPPAGLIKLDSMENPYRWPASLRRAWLARLNRIEINRYPDARVDALRQQARHAFTVPDAFDILPGNGSDELLQLLCMAVALPGRKVLVPEPSFEMYRTIACLSGLNVVGVPLDTEQFSVIEQAMFDAVARERPALVLLASPNNPTGISFPTSFVRALAGRTDGIVLLDEAYCRFAGGSVMRQLADLDNVLFLQTLSKIGLAGIRVGLLFGHPDWLTEIDKVRMPYNVNALSQETATFALEHIDLIQHQIETICAERERLRTRLNALPGLHVWPSQANFLLVRVAAGGARAFTFLRDHGVLVKNLTGKHPTLHDCLRITVGKPAENAALLALLRRFLKSPGQAG